MRRFLLALLIATPFLVIFLLGGFLFENNNLKTLNSVFINKVEADIPYWDGGGGGGGGGGGEGGPQSTGGSGSPPGSSYGSGVAGYGGRDPGDPGFNSSLGFSGRSDISDTSDTNNDTGDNGDNSGDAGDGDGGDGGGGCFRAGTYVAVLTKENNKLDLKKINELKPGDEIAGVKFNEKGNPFLVKSKVVKILIHEPALRRFLSIISESGADVTATDNHRFITDSNNEALPLGQISKGMKVVSAFSNPQWDEVKNIKEAGISEESVYNITTKTANYLVSRDGKGWLLVHNEK
jgi:hypothetical protein